MCSVWAASWLKASWRFTHVQKMFTHLQQESTSEAAGCGEKDDGTRPFEHFDTVELQDAT
jgi:hypothetical protein